MKTRSRWSKVKPTCAYSLQKSCELRRGTTTFGHVQSSDTGWFWYASICGKSHNSLWGGKTFATAEEAKADAVAWVEATEAEGARA